MRGCIVSQLLRRAWVANPEPRAEPADLASIEEILIRSGTAPLAWHVLHSGSAAAERLHDVWRVSRLHATRNRKRASAVIGFFREHGITPLLIKGWAIARQYPDAALRPYTDTDVVVGAEQFARAREVHREVHPDFGMIDLHALPEEWRDRDWETLIARADVVRVDDVEVLVPSPEDHLRLLAIHAMKHGIFRPLWLCDIGLMLESTFSWNEFVSGDSWLTDCALLALRLAGSLLGARIDGDPLPWAERAVLKEWSDPYRWPHGHATMGEFIRARPSSFVRELTRRWPGAIEATYNLKGPWNSFPRFPLQSAEVIRKLSAIPGQFLDHGAQSNDRIDPEAQTPDHMTEQD